MDFIPHTKMCMEDNEYMYTLLCLLSRNGRFSGTLYRINFFFPQKVDICLMWSF